MPHPPPDSAVFPAAAWFGPGPLEIGTPPSPGFSGASLARVRPAGTAAWFLVKGFAPGTTRDRASAVHALVRHLASRGVAEVPVPVVTPAGETVVTDARGGHWELVPFVDGRATETPTPAQAAAAADALARLHVAAATLPDMPVRVGPSPGVVRRIAQARALAMRPWRARRGAVTTAACAFPAAVTARWDRAITLFAAAGGERAVLAVSEARPDDTLLQPVLRDVWHAHVLFAPGEPVRVAGIVDAHAAGTDSPAGDVARLLGSWRRGSGPSSADPTTDWPDALAAYGRRRHMPATELGLVPFLHAAGVLCGLDNWFRWTLEERRAFANPGAVLDRIDGLLERLPTALEALAGRRTSRV